MRKAGKIIKTISFLLMITFVISFLTVLFRPTVRDNDFGLNWDQFLSEPKNTVDVMFYGSSHMYCSFIPMQAYHDTGVSSYVLSGPTQSMSISYYYFLESLRHQSPKVVVFELSGLIFDSFKDKYKVYRLQNISYMPFSINKMKATIANSLPDEWFSIIFDVYSYHDRWKVLDESYYNGAIEKTTGTIPVSIQKGYQILTRRHPEYALNIENPSIGFITNQVAFLKKIAAECKKRGIKLVLYSAPTVNLKTMDDAIEAAQKAVPEADLIDGRLIWDTMGLSATLDMHDLFHTNVFGAEKTTEYICNQLQNYNLPDHRLNSKYSHWEKSYEEFIRRKNELITQAEKSGYK